jgi:SAM-dependent methyltransferase
MAGEPAEQTGAGVDPLGAVGAPWQLKLFSRSLKKQQKLGLLLRQIGDVTDRDCVLVTHGDNNGALNWHFRARGGRWTWVEMEQPAIPGMSDLLGEPVLHGRPDWIPLADSSVDVAVSIDVHEHLADCRAFGRELHRVVRPGGTVVVTTPNGDPWKPATLIKRAIGMTREVYGHTVYGYNARQHRAMLEEAGLRPESAGSYSGFATEMVELAINFAYVKVLSRKRGDVPQGTIAPSSQDALRKVEKAYRVYSAVYPLMRAVSALDALTPFFTGYAVSVVGRRPR